MKIKTKVSGRTAYYVATTNGRPVTGTKDRAADFPEPLADQVLTQLRQLDPVRFDEAELVS